MDVSNSRGALDMELQDALFCPAGFVSLWSNISSLYLHCSLSKRKYIFCVIVRRKNVICFWFYKRLQLKDHLESQKRLLISGQYMAVETS